MSPIQLPRALTAGTNVKLTSNRNADDTQSINSLLLSGGVTYNFDNAVGANTLTLNGVVSGAGSIAKTGTGTLVLNSANTYAGGTTLTMGRITVGNNAALGTGALAMADGAVVAAGTGALANARSGLKPLACGLPLTMSRSAANPARTRPSWPPRSGTTPCAARVRFAVASAAPRPRRSSPPEQRGK